jgi:uncharacterized protein
VPRFEPTEAGSGPLVRGFAGNGFVVDGQRYDSVLLTPERAIGWTAPALADLSTDHLGELLALSPAPEFLLLGSGPTLRHPSAAFRQALDARGIGVEVMDSRAAARTWGVLRAEERWIVAALLPLG